MQINVNEELVNRILDFLVKNRNSIEQVSYGWQTYLTASMLAVIGVLLLWIGLKKTETKRDYILIAFSILLFGLASLVITKGKITSIKFNADGVELTSPPRRNSVPAIPSPE